MFCTSAALWWEFLNEPRTYKSGPRYLASGFMCRQSLAPYVGREHCMRRQFEYDGNGRLENENGNPDELEHGSVTHVPFRLWDDPEYEHPQRNGQAY